MLTFEGFVTAAAQHPLIAEQIARYGVAHTHGGRRLDTGKTAASQQDQEARLADTKIWTPAKRIEPVHDAIAGARSYANKVGLSDPHDVDYGKVMTSPSTIRTLGKAYDALPDHDAAALPHFEAMRKEVGDQFHHLTHTMGIQAHFVDHDPYQNASEMVDDVRKNKRLQVMRTATTGPHPLFSNEDNDKFRAVHDYFGHAATGRDFDAHGEEAAAVAHSKMFSAKALPAMASETRGQNGSLNLNGEFAPQKIALMSKTLWRPPTRSDYARMAHLMNQPMTFEAFLRTVAHDSGDGVTVFHCPFDGSGQVIARSDGTIECEFCHQAFTVQVQPRFSAFPQTVDGQPVQVPGMPDPAAGGMPGGMPPGVDPDADPNADPGADPDADPDENPFASGGDDEGDDSGKKPNPFAKGSSLRTNTGFALSPEQYLRRLALAQAAGPVREAILVQGQT